MRPIEGRRREPQGDSQAAGTALRLSSAAFKDSESKTSSNAIVPARTKPTTTGLAAAGNTSRGVCRIVRHDERVRGRWSHAAAAARPHSEASPEHDRRTGRRHQPHMPDRFRPIQASATRGKDTGRLDRFSPQHDGEDGPDDHRQPRALIDPRQESFVDTETHCCETRLPDGRNSQRDRAQRWTPGQLITA